MMNIQKQHISLLFVVATMLASATNLQAQNNTNMDKEVEVVKAYQPTINESFKITTNPVINDTVSYTPTFEYRIFSTDIPNTKTINHLPVVPLGNAPRNQSNTGFLKGGIGNAWTPYGEILFNTTPSNKTDFGFQLYHFSSKPKIKLNTNERVSTPFSYNVANIFVKNYFRKATLEWDMKYTHDRFDYYGFPLTDTIAYQQNLLTSPTLNKKQALNNAATQFKLSSLNTKSNNDYTIQLAYNYFWNATEQQSHHGKYNGTFTIRKRNMQVIIPTEADYYLQSGIINYIDSTLTNHQNIYAGIKPYIWLNKKAWELKAGANIGLLLDSDTSSTFHISPRLYFAYHPIQGIISLFAGADGSLRVNDYTSMVATNPYIHFQTDARASQDLLTLYGGIKGKISRKISYLFDLNYSITRNELFYYQKESIYQDWQTVVRNTFDILYADINTLRFGGNIRYSDEQLTIALKGNYFSYSTSTLDKIINKPDFDAGLETFFKINDRIGANANATVIGARNAMIERSTITKDPVTGLYLPGTTSNEYSSLKTIIDVSLGATYKYSKNLSFFLSANNLLNQNYQYWNGYNSRGILVLAGGHFSF